MADIRTTAKVTLRVLALVGLQLLLLIPAQADEEEATRLAVEGISASLGEDEPRVLYILPWQAPSLPKRPRADLNNEAPELVRPVDPIALERHRLFRENLNPLILSPVGDSGLAEQ